MCITPPILIDEALWHTFVEACVTHHLRSNEVLDQLIKEQITRWDEQSPAFLARMRAELNEGPPHSIIHPK
jgi:hypothetical protein